MIFKTLQHISIVLGVIISLGGAYAAATTFGLDIPRVAWNTEVNAIELKLVGLDIKAQTLIVDQIQRQKWTLEDRIDQRAEKNRGPATRTQKDRMRELERQLEEAKSRLKKIRGY